MSNNGGARGRRSGNLTGTKRKQGSCSTQQHRHHQQSEVSSRSFVLDEKDKTQKNFLPAENLGGGNNFWPRGLRSSWQLKVSSTT